MKVDSGKIFRLLAEKGMKWTDLRECMSLTTLYLIRNNPERETSPKVVGNICRMLNCHPSDIEAYDNPNTCDICGKPFTAGCHRKLEIGKYYVAQMCAGCAKEFDVAREAIRQMQAKEAAKQYDA